MKHQMKRSATVIVFLLQPISNTLLGISASHPGLLFAPVILAFNLHHATARCAPLASLSRCCLCSRPDTRMAHSRLCLPPLFPQKDDGPPGPAKHRTTKASIPKDKRNRYHLWRQVRTNTYMNRSSSKLTCFQST